MLGKSSQSRFSWILFSSVIADSNLRISVTLEDKGGPYLSWSMMVPDYLTERSHWVNKHQISCCGFRMLQAYHGLPSLLKTWHGIKTWTNLKHIKPGHSSASKLTLAWKVPPCFFEYFRASRKRRMWWQHHSVALSYEMHRTATLSESAKFACALHAQKAGAAVEKRTLREIQWGLAAWKTIKASWNL